jgi:hypothetical protein
MLSAGGATSPQVFANRASRASPLKPLKQYIYSKIETLNPRLVVTLRALVKFNQVETHHFRLGNNDGGEMAKT